MRELRYIIQITILLFFSHFTSGQTTIEIKKPNLNFNNGQLIISYNLDNTDYEYSITIEIVNSTGIKINANALSGDVGPDIKAGENKTIVWSLNQDNIFLDEEISVRIIANILPRKYNRGILLLQSSVWPGWGQTKLKNGKPFWLIGFSGVACIAGSYLYNQKSNNSYDKYVTAISADESTKYYDQATSQDNTSKILAYSAIGIWAVNLIWVAVMPNEIKTTPSSQKISLQLAPVNLGDKNASIALGIRLNL